MWPRSPVSLALLLPSYGIGRGAFEGDWQGVFTTKNVLGLTMLVTIMVLRSAGAGSTALRRVAGCGMAVATGALILSGSVASLIVLLVVTVTTPLLSLVRRSHNRKALALACAYVAVFIGVMMTVDGNSLVRAMDSERTLTGRRRSRLPLLSASTNGLFGYGYDAFWSSAQDLESHA